MVISLRPISCPWTRVCSHRILQIEPLVNRINFLFGQEGKEVVIELKMLIQFWDEISFTLKEITLSCETHVWMWIWTAPKMQ